MKTFKYPDNYPLNDVAWTKKELNVMQRCLGFDDWDAGKQYRDNGSWREITRLTVGDVRNTWSVGMIAELPGCSKTLASKIMEKLRSRQ